MTEAQANKYRQMKEAGWEFSHNENGSVIMEIRGHTMESSWVIEQIEVTPFGEVRKLPKD